MATPDYVPPITPPPGPGSVNDLPASGGGSDPLFGITTQPYPGSTGYQPGTQTGVPDYSTPIYDPVSYAPNQVEIPKSGVQMPTIKDAELPEMQIKAPPTPHFEGQKDMAPVPDMPDYGPMSQFIPKDSTQQLTKDDPEYDWERIAGKAPGVTPDQTVQGQLEKLFAEGSPLLKYAQGLGTQYANQRGLINSDIAAQAGSMAVFNQAVPIAAQDANTYAARAQQEAQFWQTAGLQAQQATIASALQAQDHLERMREQALQGDINSQLQLEQFGYNWELNEQQNIHQQAQMAFQGNIQAKLNLQELGIDVERMRHDYGYRLFMQKESARDTLKIAGYNADRELEYAAYQQKYALDQIDRNTQRRIDELNRQAQINADARNQGAQIDAAARRQQAEIDAQARDQQAGIDWNARNQQADLDTQARQQEYEQRDKEREDTQAWNEEQYIREATDNLKQNYFNATERRTSQFSAEVTSIYSQPGLTPTQQRDAVEIARNNYLTDIANITAFYSQSEYWDPSWMFTPADTPANPNPTSPPPPTAPPPDFTPPPSPSDDDVHTLPPPGSTPYYPGFDAEENWRYQGDFTASASTNYQQPSTELYNVQSTNYSALEPTRDTRLSSRYNLF